MNDDNNNNNYYYVNYNLIMNNYDAHSITFSSLFKRSDDSKYLSGEF